MQYINYCGYKCNNQYCCSLQETNIATQHCLFIKTVDRGTKRAIASIAMLSYQRVSKNRVIMEI